MLLYIKKFVKNYFVTRYAFHVTREGFTLVELMVTIAIFALAGVSILSLFNWSIKTVVNYKAEAAALTISNHKIEMIRNLSYNKVGTVGGIPTGDIPQTETIIFNNKEFAVKTYVKYYDDPFDGLAGGTDTLPTDYKIVQITVSWTNFWGKKSTDLSTIITPKGMETMEGGGTLTVIVFNSNGLPVDSANVSIQNDISDPFVLINTFTNADGRVSFPGAPASAGYKIAVSKTGYSTDYTCKTDSTGMGCSASEGNPNPSRPEAIVLEGQLTEIGFAIDLLSNINIKTVYQNFPQGALSHLYTNENQDNHDFFMDELGNYYFIWRDDRSSQERIYAQKYNASYIPQWVPQDLQISASNNQNNPSVAVDSSGNIYIAWVDDRESGNLHMYLTKIDSSGNNVFNDKKITTQDGSSRQYNPEIVLSDDDNYIYIAWQDDLDDAGDIYLQKLESVDGDNVWAIEKKVNSNAGVSLQAMPQLSTAPNYVYVVWQDERSGDNNIYSQKFDSDGNKSSNGQWLGDVLINNDSAGAKQLNSQFILSNDNNHIYAIWQDERNDAGDIYLQKFNADGNLATSSNWADGNLLVNQYQEGAQILPNITIDNLNNIYISWTDGRNNGDIYLQKFDADGNRLWDFDVKINSDNTNSTQTNSILAINPINNKLVISWQDDIMGNENIYVSSFSSPVRINLANIDFNLHGEKRIGEDPVIYKYNANHFTDGSGEAILSNIEWDAYHFDVASSTGLVLLTSDMTLPLTVNPNENSNIILYLQSNTGNSYLAIIKNQDMELIQDALVHLYSAGESYDQIIATNSYGQAFFISLSNSVYDLEISADGYIMATSTVNINEEIIEETILLQ
ncbi:MAG: prepilin-type N-terminal cleavage/methylation domain-containing protein [Patescibacteria group bacterium]